MDDALISPLSCHLAAASHCSFVGFAPTLLDDDGFAPPPSAPSGITPLPPRDGITPLDSHDGITPSSCRGSITPPSAPSGIIPQQAASGITPHQAASGITPQLASLRRRPSSRMESAEPPQASDIFSL
jgi:hypothetical protein